MPISFPEPPRPVEEALEQSRARGLPGILRRRGIDLGGAPDEAPVLPAQPVFSVGLDELLEPGGGEEAEKSVSAPPSWRYSGFDAEGRPEVMELAQEATGGAVATGDDRFSAMIREALAAADQDPRVAEHGYEARLFRVPALSLLALWLHTGAASDLFVPLGRTVPELEPNRVYSDEEFMKEVRAAAERIGGHYAEAEDADELGS